MDSGSTSAGTIIFKAFMPTLKMVLCILLGFFATKKGWLTAAGAKGLGAIVIQITLPALMFSSMVTAFTPENIGAFGPLMVIAIMYQLLGLSFAWVIRELFYVPIDFRWGILVSGLTSNWGNLPTAIVQTMAKEAPFNPAVDVDLGVAYVAIFIFIMNTTFWALGVHKLCAWDFQENRRRQDQAPLKERWSSQLESTKGKFSKMTGLRSRTKVDLENQVISEAEMTDRVEDTGDDKTFAENDIEPYVPPASSSSNQVSASVLHDAMPTTPPSLTQSSSRHSHHSGNTIRTDHADSDTRNPDIEMVRKPKTSLWKRILHFIRDLPNVTKAIVIAIPISTIQPLKSLFATTEGWTGGKMPNAPDGNPPLHFIIETASFLGAIAVPGALLLLGASFARLKMPKNWKELPIGAIIALTTSKMILVPVFGIFIIQALRDHTTLLPRADKTDSLSTFLLLQYALMFILSTALTAIALYIVER
ncbi:uncharacterized protein IL334_006892 [Kwoniella shivajii]|uniref:Auxin efflux carrier n=1 Tax=Kwoniella shivajii TaxID=564305 RepID=A0ABZ1D7X5_9TREE|nr:hypothetical protein IL334_006892 [Kwoniella shivajii]